MINKDVDRLISTIGSSKQTYAYDPKHLKNSEPSVFEKRTIQLDELILNIGPQHPSTHGVLRIEVLTDGEMIKELEPHLGYLHRCFEKHTESLTYPQIIPYVDRLDYVAAMNSEHIYAMGVEQMLGITEQIPKRVEYIRVLVAELNRIASHFIAIGTYGMDIGAVSPFLWAMRDREYILQFMEWLTGARMLYNYIWIGGLYYDLPYGFEDKIKEYLCYLKPKLDELDNLLIFNPIYINRTANIGVLPFQTAINYGCSGPILRGSGLGYDLRKVDGYSVYPELDFDIPVGRGEMGTIGDCWDRTWVRMQECRESIKIVEQCLEKLTYTYPRNPDFDPRAMVPKKIRPEAQDLYFRGESSKGELGFFFRADGTDKPFRCKARGCSFSNLSVLPALSKNVWMADLIAIIGSLDFVMGEVDR